MSVLMVNNYTFYNLFIKKLFLKNVFIKNIEEKKYIVQTMIYVLGLNQHENSSINSFFCSEIEHQKFFVFNIRLKRN